MPSASEPLAVRCIGAAQHRDHVEAASGSFLQTPAWGKVKSDWASESLGWFEGERLVGAGLVLYRTIPRTRRSLAYLPEGPVLDWEHYSAAAVTRPLLTHLKERKAFTVKMGPPVVARRWRAATVKEAIAEGRLSLADVPADETASAAQRLRAELQQAGWRRQPNTAGFGDFQPRFVFQVPLRDTPLDDVFSGFNQLWRRNIRKAEKSGVVVRKGSLSDLDDFHRIYVETAARDGFRPRPLSYFQRMWRAMHEENDDRLRLYLAEHDGSLLAATTWVRVGHHVWYSYGASTSQGRELRPSNAIQWQMLKDAHAAGAHVYDLRGISDTLDSNDPLFGLIQFKLGTGGHAVEFVGEWDFPLNRILHRAFTYYLKRR